MSGVPSGLDFGAVFAIAQANGTDLELLADALPEVELMILAGQADDGDIDPNEPNEGSED